MTATSQQKSTSSDGLIQDRYFVIGNWTGERLATSGQIMTPAEAEALPCEVWRFYAASAARAELIKQAGYLGNHHLGILRGN